jgi:hypothetical protein
MEKGTARPVVTVSRSRLRPHAEAGSWGAVALSDDELCSECMISLSAELAWGHFHSTEVLHVEGGER